MTDYCDVVGAMELIDEANLHHQPQRGISMKNGCAEECALIFQTIAVWVGLAIKGLSPRRQEKRKMPIFKILIQVENRN